MNKHAIRATADLAHLDVTHFIGSAKTAKPTLPEVPDAAAAREDRSPESKAKVTELYDTIASTLAPKEDCRTVNLKHLEQRLYLQHVVFGASITKALALLHRIRDATRHHGLLVQSLDQSKAWRMALSAACDIAALRGDLLNYAQPPDARTQRTAFAGQYLRRKGYAVKLKDTCLSIPEKERIRIASRIKYLVAIAGGPQLLERILNAATSTYDQEQERYHIVTHVRKTGGADSDMPIGYLVNLCAATLEGAAEHELAKSDVGMEIVELATQFVATLDVQVASPFETMRLGYEDSIRVLRDLAFTDNVRAFPQLAPTRLLVIVDELSCRLPTDLSPVPLLDAAKLARGVFHATQGAHGLCFLDPGTICLHSQLTRDELTNLAPFFSTPVSEVNKDYLLPEDFTKASLYNKPLIAVSDGYWLTDPAIAAHGFLKAFLELLKGYNARAGSAIGLATEEIVRERAKAKGLQVEHGIYLVDGEQGECDCVIESEHYVYFIECKYRDFHHESRTQDAYLLQDLRKVVIEPLAQAGGHEVLLRTRGYLELTQEGKQYRLEWRGRKIERVAVTLQEFGSLQSREIVERFMTLSTGALWNSTDSRGQLSLSALRKLSKKLCRQYQALLDLGVLSNDNGQPHFNCWSLSLSQLLMILDEVSPGQSFDEVMEKTRHVRSGTLDEYYERKRMCDPSGTLRQLVEFGKTNPRGFIIA